MSESKLTDLDPETGFPIRNIESSLLAEDYSPPIFRFVHDMHRHDDGKFISYEEYLNGN